jgi:hypothetical protein
MIERRRCHFTTTAAAAAAAARRPFGDETAGAVENLLALAAVGTAVSSSSDESSTFIEICTDRRP